MLLSEGPAQQTKHLVRTAAAVVGEGGPASKGPRVPQKSRHLDGVRPTKKADEKKQGVS